jgi:hypothetical protein
LIRVAPDRVLPGGLVPLLPGRGGQVTNTASLALRIHAVV